LQKGCNFWEWELEYVLYLIDHDVIQGDAAVHALGWAEERREALKLKQEELKATEPAYNEVLMLSVYNMVKEVVLLLKIVLGVLVVMCAVLVLKK
jgi:hypothetical protein